MSREGKVAIATSIAPFNIETQYKATKSWCDRGFRIISINTAEEIVLLKESFPHVDFIETERHAKHRYGKPYVYLEDVLGALVRSEFETVGIVNSDIYLYGVDAGILDFLEQETQDALVYGSRFDVPDLDPSNNEPVNRGSVYRDGFDFFFFKRQFISVFPQNHLCLGIPWWDYWILLVPLLNGLKIKKLVTPIAYHILHRLNWSDKPWRELAGDIARLISEPIPQSDQEIINLAHHILARLQSESHIIIYHRNKVVREKVTVLHGEAEIEINAVTNLLKDQTYSSIEIAPIKNRSSIDSEWIYFSPRTESVPPYLIEFLVSEAQEQDEAICCTFMFMEPKFAYRRLNFYSMAEQMPLQIWNETMGMCTITRAERRTRKNPRVIDYNLVLVSFYEYVSKLLAPHKEKKIYIYSAGGHTAELLQEGHLSEFTIAGIIDSNPTISLLHGIPVYPVSQLNELMPEVILISSYSYESEIYTRLKSIYEESKLIRIYHNAEIQLHPFQQK